MPPPHSACYDGARSGTILAYVLCPGCDLPLVGAPRPAEHRSGVRPEPYVGGQASAGFVTVRSAGRQGSRTRRLCHSGP
jgi:hypothetical protein